MREDYQNSEIDVWTPQGKQHAIDMFFDGHLPDETFENLSYQEQQIFCNAVIQDERLSLKERAGNPRATYEMLEEALPSYVPRDKTTKILLSISVALMFAGALEPTLFLEGLGGVFVGATTLRGMIVGETALRGVLSKIFSQNSDSLPDVEVQNLVDIPSDEPEI